MLKEYVEEFDPKLNASVTIGSNYNAWENGQECTDIVKLAGNNYGERLYHTQHAERPDWIIYGSETSSVVQSRGIRLVICGRSPIDKNTIHIQFSDENGENRQIVEFMKTDGYEEQVFELERVTGLKKVAFIFLPGSQFDFKGFRFER